MEKLISFSNWVLLIFFLIIPIILFLALELNRQKSTNNLIKISGILLILILPVAFGWWTDKSTEILLKHYNALTYSIDFDTYLFSIDNVKPENIKRVKQLESSYFGIGWPLKVIMTFVFYSPVVLIIYLIQLVIIRLLKKRNYFSLK